MVACDLSACSLAKAPSVPEQLVSEVSRSPVERSMSLSVGEAKRASKPARFPQLGARRSPSAPPHQSRGTMTGARPHGPSAVQHAIKSLTSREQYKSLSPQKSRAVQSKVSLS